MCSLYHRSNLPISIPYQARKSRIREALIDPLLRYKLVVAPSNIARSCLERREGGIDKTNINIRALAARCARRGSLSRTSRILYYITKADACGLDYSQNATGFTNNNGRYFYSPSCCAERLAVKAFLTNGVRCSALGWESERSIAENSRKCSGDARRTM